MNEALTKKLYRDFDIQKITLDDLNGALDYISDMFKFLNAGMSIDYIKESINELTNAIFKSSGKKYLKSIQPADGAAERIKMLKSVIKDYNIYVPEPDLLELKTVYGDLPTIRRKFAFFGVKIHTSRLFSTGMTLNHIYNEIRANFMDLLPESTSHLDEYIYLFDLIDHKSERYITLEDDPQLEERKEDLNGYIFDKIEKPVYTPKSEKQAATDLYNDLLRQEHLLIAGTTGSGKSYLINKLIETLKQKDNVKLVLIDPKHVELYDHKDHKNVLLYEDDYYKTSEKLKWLCKVQDQIYQALRNNGEKRSTAADIYIFIDEFSDLVNSEYRDEINSSVQRLIQLGRAAGIHVILATQRPTNEVIPGKIKCCFPAKIALRTVTAQESRNIIGIAGAEKFPRVGKALYISPDLLKITEIDIL